MKYKSKGGVLLRIHPSVTEDRVLDRVMEAEQTLDNPGFCLACGEDADECEPDARHYECQTCGAHAVFGGEEVLFLIAHRDTK